MIKWVSLKYERMHGNVSIPLNDFEEVIVYWELKDQSISMYSISYFSSRNRNAPPVLTNMQVKQQNNFTLEIFMN